jgi:SGNH domain (fused to AT3 domains)
MLNRYRAREGGKGLPDKASNEAMVDGYAFTLKTLRSAGAPVAVIEDVPRPDKDVPECVSQSLDRLQDCAFSRRKALEQPRINVLAAEEVEGASLIDPTPMVCPGETCPTVIGDVLVYRNGAHLTRTYVNTLTPWLGEQLPEPAG